MLPIYDEYIKKVIVKKALMSLYCTLKELDWQRLNIDQR
jgi:hypothetical protein